MTILFPAREATCDHVVRTISLALYQRATATGQTDSEAVHHCNNSTLGCEAICWRREANQENRSATTKRPRAIVLQSSHMPQQTTQWVEAATTLQLTPWSGAI